MKDNVEYKQQPSAENLMQAIKEVWVAEITQKYRECLVSSMLHRIQSVIASKGKHLKEICTPQRKYMLSGWNHDPGDKFDVAQTEHFESERRKEGNVLFNDALNTFYLRLYGVRHMVKDHSDSEKGNPLPPHRLLFTINSKGSFICTIPQT